MVQIAHCFLVQRWNNVWVIYRRYGDDLAPCWYFWATESLNSEACPSYGFTVIYYNKCSIGSSKVESGFSLFAAKILLMSCLFSILSEDEMIQVRMEVASGEMRVTTTSPNSPGLIDTQHWCNSWTVSLTTCCLSRWLPGNSGSEYKFSDSCHPTTGARDSLHWF